jgi:transposase
MSSESFNTSSSLDSVPIGTHNEMMQRMQNRVSELERQVDWFRRQIFGQKSERRIVLEGGQEQLPLVAPTQPSAPPATVREIAAHSRRKSQTKPESDEPAPLFDRSKLPVERIELSNPAVEGLNPDQYEVVSQKISHRLAQRPGSYVILEYVRPVVKIKSTQQMHCPSAPASVIEGSWADVSFVVGLLVEKFQYHLPLYRQHSRVEAAGIRASRPWLTQLVHKACALLEPIYDAQLASIQMSRVKAMDETPIKAARDGPGKMKQGYFWPIYGELDEIVFPFFPSRATQPVFDCLGVDPAQGAVLLSDGFAVYERYAKKTGITHAQCWAHSRRGFVEAHKIEPERVGEALDFIARLYRIEQEIRDQDLHDEDKKRYRQTHAGPVLEQFFIWVRAQLDAQGLIPTNAFHGALGYVKKRETGLKVYLDDPQVPIDTNHLERALRSIPMGRRAWQFCWTETGAKYVGIAQSLITTCRMHDIDPYEYLVDILQRIAIHPAARVHELTPRLWKQHFAEQPLRSDLHKIDAK